MKLYNTMTRQKETLETAIPGEVTVYACGPTVYNLMHIGNARQICVFDVLRRYLEYSGRTVTYAQNFTDVDDKIINKANAEGKSWQEIAQTYIEAYFEDARGLNVRDADIHPKATENMQVMIEMIQELIDKGYAYRAITGDVYFSTAAFSSYGELSQQPLEDLQAGARIATGEDKRDPMDFALWKAAKPGEPYWETPFGNGRPGWHIECSAMVKRLFGDTVDIHGGGRDLIFPHHENENAQSHCVNNAPLARYWMHNGFVNVDNQKMSKSLNNFFTVREVAALYGYEPIRYLLLSSHYRSPLNYSAQSLDQAVAALTRLHNCRDNLKFRIQKAKEEKKSGDEEKVAAFLAVKARFIEAMEDDLNTADAIGCLFDLAKEINISAISDENSSKWLCEQALTLFMELADIIGLLYPVKDEHSAQTAEDAEIDRLVTERTKARLEKNWARADALRDELNARNVIVEDTPNGVKWHIKTAQ